MQDYNNMELTQLAQELSKLEDEQFCIILKDIEDDKLKQLFDLVNVDRKIRVFQEISARKENSNINKNQLEKVEQKLRLEPTQEGIAPTPNLILRSSLFSASKTHGAHDHAVRDFKITTYGGKAEIYLTAFRQFNQLDLDLLLELIKLQQEQKQHVIRVSAYEIIKRVKGSGESQQYYEQIKEQLEILQNASIKIKAGRYTFVGGILNNAFFDDKEKRYLIEFNSKIEPMFSGNNWTGIDTNIRKQLKTNLAKWLHGFYSSHLNSKIPIKLETIYELSGATDKDIARWIRVRVVNALENLQTIFRNNGKKFSYQIKDHYLLVNKTQTISQNKSIKNTIITKK